VSEIRVNDITLYYEEHGQGDPILCLHGAGSSALLWGDAVGALAERGRTIVYDRRGCTRSQRPDPYPMTSVADQADDAVGLLDALGATPAVLIGRSYGGEIAVEVARRHPTAVRALVLLEPALLTLSDEARAWADRMLADVRAAAADGPAAAADRFYRIVLGDQTWAGLPDEIHEIFLDNGPTLLAELTGEWTTPTAEGLAHLTQPALIVSGESSPPVFQAADATLAGMIPGARHEVIGGGHLVNPAAPVVLAFLDGLTAPSIMD
jgi:esterase